MSESTADPYVVIEARGPDWVSYRNTSSGRRWEVRGVCDRRGDCLIGAVLDDGTVIRDHAHLAELGDRPDSMYDVPVTPEFDSCCGSDIFTYAELS